MYLDRFYHHLFASDRHAIGLIRELGLEGELIWRRPLTVTLRDGRVHQLDSAGSLLRFRPLPLWSRVRMGAWLAYLRLLSSPERLEGKTAAAWIERRMGRRAYEVVWGPLLRGKFGDLADQIAMPWFWARVHDRTASLGYLRGGFQRLYDRLAERIRRGWWGAALRDRGDGDPVGARRDGGGDRRGDAGGGPGGVHPGRAAHLPAHARAVRGVSAQARVGDRLRRALPGAGPRPAADAESTG